MDETIGTQPDLRLEMYSQARYLAAARALIGSLAQRLGFNEVLCGQISLAVDEALCNVINHGYERRDNGRIWISVWVNDSPPGLRIVLEDEARQVDPANIRSRELDDVRPGGLGVHLINEIMDEVRYERREKEGMRLTMVKSLPDEHGTKSPRQRDSETSRGEPPSKGPVSS